METTYTRVSVWGVVDKEDKILFTDLLYNELKECYYGGNAEIGVVETVLIGKENPNSTIVKQNGMFDVLLVPTYELQNALNILNSNGFATKVWGYGEYLEDDKQW